MTNPSAISGDETGSLQPKLFISLLCGSGSVKIDTLSSLIMTIQHLILHKVRYELGLLANITGVDSARNINAEIFTQKSDCTHMLMIDDDMAWSADLPLRLLRENVDIVGVPYRTKNIKRERWTARHTEGEQHCMSADKLYMMKMNALGTGMMLVKRNVFEFLKPKVEHAEMGDNNQPVAQYFRHGIIDGKIRSEDFMFCEIARAAGFDVWAYVDEDIAHIGNYAYTGNYADKLDTDETKFRSGHEKISLRMMLE